MKLAVALPYTDTPWTEVVEYVQVAEKLGYEAVFVAEAYSYDAVSIMAALAMKTARIKIAAGILNVYSRSPALIAQSAGALDMLSNGRFILGLGTSGPQVVQGWHGIPFEKPLQRTREVIEIVRMALRRERLNYDGETIKLDMGLKLINHPVRDAVPIIVAALGPKNLELTGELADGWMPTLFAPNHMDVFKPHLDAGLAKTGRNWDALEITPAVITGVYDDVDTIRQMVKPYIALYVGGMGSRERNFYNQLVQRYGYVEEARQIQDLYLARDKAGAAARVPDTLVDETSAVGPVGRVKEKLAELAAVGVTMPVLGIMAFDQETRLKTLEALAP
ncbi:MAG TPA: LLM class F420-dependent oxidoreductase [Candidatus Dormibacteraeota bacterium]|nr:LLM class F420-dependent oxidoreductase [Candidatus Dormibacteraeota bacterium]